MEKHHVQWDKVRYTYNVGLPSYVCWFIHPMNTIVIGIINHSY